jgi:hypothetical protein
MRGGREPWTRTCRACAAKAVTDTPYALNEWGVGSA